MESTIDLIPTREIAPRLKLSVCTVLRLAKARLLPKIHASKTDILFDWSAVLSVLAKFTVWELGRPADACALTGDWLTPEELAARIGCTVRVAKGLASRRLIPKTRIGKVMRFSSDAVDYALDNLIDARECAARLGVPVGALYSMTGANRLLSTLGRGQRFRRYHWPAVHAAISRASAAATVVKLS